MMRNEIGGDEYDSDERSSCEYLLSLRNNKSDPEASRSFHVYGA